MRPCVEMWQETTSRGRVGGANLTRTQIGKTRHKARPRDREFANTMLIRIPFNVHKL